MQYLLSIDGLITGIVALIFGFIVLAKNKKNIINQTGFLLTLTTAMWALGYWQWLSIYDDKELALLWTRILSIGSTLIPVFYYHWILTLLDLHKQKKKSITIFYFIAFFFLFFSFSNAFIKGVEPVGDLFAFWPKAGWMYTVYLFVVYFGLVTYSLMLLFKNYKKSFGLKREQIRIVLIGSILGFGGGATNFFLWYDIPIPPIGNFLVVLYPVLFSYSIIKHRFMDIKMVMRRYSVYTVSLVTIIMLSFSLGWGLNKLFPEFIFWNDSIVLILAITIFPGIKNYFYKVANKYFFSSLYDSREVIAGISEKLRRTLDINIIFDYIYETINNAFHIKSFGILRYREGKDNYVVQYNKGFNVRWQEEFKSNSELHEIYIKKNRTLILEEAKSKYYNDKTKDTIDMLAELNIDILTPLNVKDKTVGLLALGPKESGDMYNDEDLQVLEIIGAQAAIAIENALLFEETKQFGLKLEKEVKKATGDLRKANKKLKKLDSAKSEFISIASHQLRTPLTIIKGYISMILEGSFGELTEGEEDSLEKVYESNERLIQLVENLLNISRIESGRLQFNFERMQLEILTHSVYEELETSARKKGVKLILKAPKKTLPAIKIDQEKIRQVIMNLIDNAIKYTKKGSVTISVRKINSPGLGQAKEGVEFSVSDSGMGITQADLSNLFKKFSRGTDTALVHTEGTGLGLFVAKQMIEAHKGRIWAESKGEGRGSRFCFVLPIK